MTIATMHTQTPSTPTDDRSLIHVEGLTVAAGSGKGRLILDDVRLHVASGEVLGIVGESGSGKSTLALALMGHFKTGLRPISGQIAVKECDVLSASVSEIANLRRSVVSYVPQNAGLCLTPTKRIGAALEEVLFLRGNTSAKSRRDLAIGLLEAVRLPNAGALAGRYPHELSGGQQQRCAIAMALAADAEILILDEPTSALDATTVNEFLALLKQLKGERALTIVCITHDMKVVGRLCSQVAVMQKGKLVEAGRCGDVLNMPRHAYTKMLLDAQLGFRETLVPSKEPVDATARVLDIERVSVRYGAKSGLFGLASRLGRAAGPAALDDVSMTLLKGRIVGVIGESGSGKSTLLKAIVGARSPSQGKILFQESEDLARVTNRPTELRRRIQMIWQNPLSALNPKQTVFEAIEAPLRLYFDLSLSQRRARASELLAQVKLTDEFLDRFPAELSGGQAQRVAIARACAAQPDVLLCDEITSALDVSVQASVLDLIRTIRSTSGCSILFVSHDLAVIAAIADDILVLKNGKVCEAGPVYDVLQRPGHPYTRSLVEAFEGSAGAIEEAIRP